MQILSNEEKRWNFDRYGDVGENQGFPQQQQQQPHRPFHPFHESFYFDESFFHFPFNSERRDSIDEKYLLHFSHYINEIVPDSFRKPYLIKITSDWCFSCIHIEPVWKEVVQELEGMGERRPGAGLSLGLLAGAGGRRRAFHFLPDCGGRLELKLPAPQSFSPRGDGHFCMLMWALALCNGGGWWLG